MAPAGESGSPLLYSDFQYIRFSKSSPAANSSISGDTAAQVSDAEKFNLQFSDFSEISETADKLRWLRYQKGLRQRDVAVYAGIYRSTYIHYEEYGKDFYSPEHMEKIAQLFDVPVERFLDDYNLFLRNDQGAQIKAIRMKLGLTQREYADKLGVSLGSLKQWEQNRKQIFKSTWEKYFKQSLESCE